jgi:hypothetical protein
MTKEQLTEKIKDTESLDEIIDELCSRHEMDNNEWNDVLLFASDRFKISMDELLSRVEDRDAELDAAELEKCYEAQSDQQFWERYNDWNGDDYNSMN